MAPMGVAVTPMPMLAPVMEGTAIPIGLGIALAALDALDAPAAPLAPLVVGAWVSVPMNTVMPVSDEMAPATSFKLVNLWLISICIASVLALAISCSFFTIFRNGIQLWSLYAMALLVTGASRAVISLCVSFFVFSTCTLRRFVLAGLVAHPLSITAIMVKTRLVFVACNII